jgi:hypothetical protein
MSSLKSRRIVVLALVVCIAILAMGMAATGCGGKATIVGKWQDPADQSITEFTSDGKVVASSLEGMEATYTDVDGKVTVTALGQTVITFTYTIDGDTMTATDPVSGEKTELTRVK